MAHGATGLSTGGDFCAPQESWEGACGGRAGGKRTTPRRRAGGGGHWSRHPDSDRGPADYKSAALPTELCRPTAGIAGPRGEHPRAEPPLPGPTAPGGGKRAPARAYSITGICHCKEIGVPAPPEKGERPMMGFLNDLRMGKNWPWASAPWPPSA